MRAAVLHGPDEIEVADVDHPQIADDEILVRVGANTLCGTDLRILRGEKTSGIDPPTILGHEFAGNVAEVGRDVHGFDVGALVAMAPGVACLRCFFCRHGRENLCPNQKMMGYQYPGGLSEYVRVPATALEAGNVLVAEQERPPEHLALAEPLSCCVNGQERSRVGLDQTVLLLGAGPIGLMHLQLALLAGARSVIVSEPAPKRRKLVGDMGASVVVDPTDGDLDEAVADATGGLGPDVTIVCIGLPELMPDALRLTRPGGRVNVFAGLAGEGWSRVQANLIHYNELEITGTSACRREHYATAFRLIETGRVDVQPLVTHRFALESIEEAMRASAEPEGIKVAVLPADGTGKPEQRAD
ncbi:MAG: zinc-dependent dehydrogenase [Actinomycetota bacterium]|nr:zinc-dependent dehydrogenase [Actinomycetota bacterium]